MKRLQLGLALVSFALFSVVSSQTFAWQELGEKTYGMCAGCHGSEGAGIPGVFPPFAGTLPTLVAQDGGRAYLIKTLLYGLSGEITVAGENYNGYMSAWETLSDEQIAAVLNYSLHAWDNDNLLADDFSILLPEEVAAARDADLAPEDVLELRKALNLSTDD